MTNPIQDLEEVRRKISALEVQEATIVAKIIKEAKHDKLGQSTYEMYGKKVVIKTSENIRLDKALLAAVWTPELPINRIYSYSLRTKDYDAIMKSGTAAQRKQLSQIVTTSPAKPMVKVES